ncbi:hypothetical protein [secondary endosymbiont of Ctenarytaina eucalypti]
MGVIIRYSIRLDSVSLRLLPDENNLFSISSS